MAKISRSVLAVEDVDLKTGEVRYRGTREVRSSRAPRFNRFGSEFVLLYTEGIEAVLSGLNPKYYVYLMMLSGFMDRQNVISHGIMSKVCRMYLGGGVNRNYVYRWMRSCVSALVDAGYISLLDAEFRVYMINPRVVCYRSRNYRDELIKRFDSINVVGVDELVVPGVVADPSEEEFD